MLSAISCILLRIIGGQRISALLVDKSHLPGNLRSTKYSQPTPCTQETHLATCRRARGVLKTEARKPQRWIATEPNDRKRFIILVECARYGRRGIEDDGTDFTPLGDAGGTNQAGRYLKLCSNIAGPEPASRSTEEQQNDTRQRACIAGTVDSQD